jgi:hypothetical protein
LAPLLMKLQVTFTNGTEAKAFEAPIVLYGRCQAGSTDSVTQLNRWAPEPAYRSTEFAHACYNRIARAPPTRSTHSRYLTDASADPMITAPATSPTQAYRRSVTRRGRRFNGIAHTREQHRAAAGDLLR